MVVKLMFVDPIVLLNTNTVPVLPPGIFWFTSAKMVKPHWVSGKPLSVVEKHVVVVVSLRCMFLL